MMGLIQHPSFFAAPTHGKMATDGEWEKAGIFRPGSFTEERDVVHYLKSRNEVACECFFDDAFFGTRRIGPTDHLVEFVLSFMRNLGRSQSGSKLFEALRSELNIKISEHFAFAEIGAVDAWKSIGAFRIDNPLGPLNSFESFYEALSASPVGQDRTYKKAIEFAFDNLDGTYHWIALPISSDSRIVQGRLRESLEFFCRAI